VFPVRYELDFYILFRCISGYNDDGVIAHAGRFSSVTFCRHYLGSKRERLRRTTRNGFVPHALRLARHVARKKETCGDPSPKPLYCNTKPPVARGRVLRGGGGGVARDVRILYAGVRPLATVAAR
jgi:hypothetical protein